MNNLSYDQRASAIRAMAELTIAQARAEEERQMAALRFEYLGKPTPTSEPLPWRELNGEDPTARSGTWILECPASNSATIIDFQQVQGGFILRQGSTSADLVHCTEFGGWDPEFEDAINGFRHFKTRVELDHQLRKLGILPQGDAS